MSYEVFFGTYTKRESKGIYKASLSDHGELSDLNVVAQIGSPTYFAIADSGLIYTVDKKENEGGVAVIKDGQIINEYLEDGPSPAYIGVDEKRQLVFVGNYHKGSLQIYKIIGEKLELTDEFKNNGNGPRPEQASSHIHFANLTPDNKLVTVDLGTDELIIFDLNEDGKLSNEKRFELDPGFGARHIRFDSTGKYAFVLGELSSKLALLEYSDGAFILKDVESTIPDDWKEHNGTAALRILKNDKFVYASNRGNDSIAVFEVDYNDSKLNRIQLIGTNGSFPRDMNITPDEKYLVVANQESDNASTYSIDTKNGTLENIQKDFYVPEAVRVYID